MPLIVFSVKFVFIFVVGFKSIFIPFTTLPSFSHPVKQMYFRLKLIYQIKTEYLEPLSRYSVLNDFLLYKYIYSFYSPCAIFLATYTPLADAWDSEWVIPLPSPMIYSPLYIVSSLSSTSTSML